MSNYKRKNTLLYYLDFEYFIIDPINHDNGLKKNVVIIVIMIVFIGINK